MYAKNDPRSTLTGAFKAAPVIEFAPASYGKFYETAPQLTRDGAKIWYHRGQNFVVAYCTLDGEATFSRNDHPDEYVVLMPDDDTVNVTVSARDDTLTASKASIFIVPPGASTVCATGKGRIVLLYTSISKDLAALCANAADYETAHPNLPAFERWPDPPAGFRLRLYPLNVPAEDGRFGCIYRCTTFMVNAFEIKPPRAATGLSPHHHDDFEQCSLALDGSYIHHIRWPWINDASKWLKDDHEVCHAPSVCIIPPPSLHTSQSTTKDGNRLFDIFSPPRHDFSAKPGWVLNADDYPTP